MRKLITLLLLLTMLVSFTGVAQAAQTGITLSDGSGQPGNTVYLAVSLSDTVTGDSIGISYSCDTAVLEAAPDACSWNKTGVLQDFDNHNQGVWAAGQSMELSGTLCVLAFRIRPGITFTSTEVSCTVSIQNSGKEVAKHTAQATVSFGCNHEYGEWTNAGNIGHSRICALCQGKQTQSHIRNNGTVKENPGSTQTDWMIYTCTVCGAEEQVEIPKAHDYPTDTEPQESTPPIHTAPTEPEENRRPGNTQPTNPGQGEHSSQGNQGNPNNDTQQDTNNTNGPRDYNTPYPEDGHDHDHPVDGMGDESLPLIIPSNQDPNAADPHAGHDHGDHTSVVSRQEQRWNGVLVFVVLAAMIGAAAYFVKKKK